MLPLGCWLRLGPRWVSLGGFEELRLHSSVALITAVWNSKGSYTQSEHSGCGVRQNQVQNLTLAPIGKLLHPLEPASAMQWKEK